MTFTKTWSMTPILTGLLLAVAGGCKSDGAPNPDSMQEFFPPYADRQIHKFQDVQIANGVRAEATLQAYHFDGSELNALGRERLNVMFEDGPGSVGTVYMNFGEGDNMDARREAVLAYVGTRGVTESDLKFVSGPNPARMSPAAGHMARLPRTESSDLTQTLDPGTFVGPTDGGGTGGATGMNK